MSGNENRLKRRKIVNKPGKKQGPDRDPEYVARDGFLLFFVENAVKKKALITKTMIHVYVKSQCRLHKIPDFSSEGKKKYISLLSHFEGVVEILVLKRI